MDGDPKNPSRHIEGDAISEEETLKYMREMKIPNLKKWREGESVLYVLDDRFRDDEKRFKGIPLGKRPNVARLDSPAVLDLSMTMQTKHGPVHSVAKDRGRIDFYMIDKVTSEPRYMYSRVSSYAYLAKPENLFEAADNIFPKHEN